MNDAMIVAADEADGIAAAIRREHEAASAAAQSAVDHALEAGRLLAEARQGIPSAYWESIKRADVAKESCARCSWPALRRGAPRCRG